MKGQRKMKNYLIKKGLQLKYAGIGFLMSLLITLIMMLFMTWNVDKLTELTTESGVSLQQGLYILKNAFLIRLGLLLLILLIINVGVSILISHKVAGVIFRLEKVIDSFLRGETPSDIHIRRGDELQDLVQKINNMFTSLRSKSSRSKEISQELKNLSNDLISKLKNKSISSEDIDIYSEKLTKFQNELESL